MDGWERMDQINHELDEVKCLLDSPFNGGIDGRIDNVIALLTQLKGEI